jgi:hypothetical protein
MSPSPVKPTFLFLLVYEKGDAVVDSVPPFPGRPVKAVESNPHLIKFLCRQSLLRGLPAKITHLAQRPSQAPELSPQLPTTLHHRKESPKEDKNKTA